MAKKKARKAAKRTKKAKGEDTITLIDRQGNVITEKSY
jgi:hypothetical protein